MSDAIKALFWYLGLCTALLLLALAFKSIGQPKASFCITGAMLLLSACIIGMICRQHK
jgi:hypothetical protein